MKMKKKSFKNEIENPKKIPKKYILSLAKKNLENPKIKKRGMELSLEKKNLNYPNIRKFKI